MSRERQFALACDALLLTMRHAADPTYPAWQPHYGHAIGVAVFYAKYVVREARTLGLYPATAVLDAEARRAA